MQIKTIPGHYLTLVRMATIESLNNKCWRGCGEKEKLLHCWRECKLVQPVWKAIWRFLRKLRLEFPCDPAVPLLGIYLDKTVIQKKTRTSRLIAALFTMAKTWNQQKCPWKWKSLYCVQLFATLDCIVHGILQTRILEWVAFPFSRGSSQPRDQTQVSRIAGGFFTSWATREALVSVDRWVDKKDVVHVSDGILLSHKKEWFNAICSNMDTAREYHTAWSKSERER